MIAPWLSRNPSEDGQLGNPEAPIVARWLRGGTVVAGGAINSRSNRGIEAMVIIDGGIESWWWRRPHNCGSPGPNQLTLGHSHFALFSVIQIGRQLLLKLLFSIIFQLLSKIKFQGISSSRVIAQNFWIYRKFCQLRFNLFKRYFQDVSSINFAKIPTLYWDLHQNSPKLFPSGSCGIS